MKSYTNTCMSNKKSKELIVTVPVKFLDLLQKAAEEKFITVNKYIVIAAIEKARNETKS